VICFIASTEDAQLDATAPPKTDANGVSPVPVAPPPILAPASGALAGALSTVGSTLGYTGRTRFSARAKQLLSVHGLSAEAFAERGLVREADVLAHIAPPAAGSRAAVPPVLPSSPAAVRGVDPGPVVGVPVRTETLPRRKRIEAKHLAAGQVHALPSAVIVACPTRGLRTAVQTQGRIQGNATAILIFEAARLLRRYPELNAYRAGDLAMYYEEVNVGFAVDIDHGLKVPVIRRADQKTIVEIADEMQELLVAYLNDSLTVESLAGGTFTLTDLSGEGVLSFTPLINRGQSAILGVGGELFLPNSPQGFFNLILAFDHGLGEGRSAARFLNELKQRLTEYERALEVQAPLTADSAAQEIACSRCYRPATELAALPAYLLPTHRADGSTRLLCTVCLQGL